MRIGKLTNLNPSTDASLVDSLQRIIKALDGNLTLADNVRSILIRNVFFNSGDTDVAVVHNLGIRTRNFLVVGCDRFARFRFGKVLPEPDRLWVRCDTAPAFADILVFV